MCYYLSKKTKVITQDLETHKKISAKVKISCI